MTELVSDEALLQMLDEDIGIMVLVQGTLPDGSAHWAYASIPPSKYLAFKQAEAKGNYDLAKFGTILAHGEGKTPPAEAQQRMADEHGANHRFEEELNGWIDQMKRQIPDQ